MRYKNWKVAAIAASLVYFFVPDEVLLENIGEQPDVRPYEHIPLSGFPFSDTAAGRLRKVRHVAGVGFSLCVRSEVAHLFLLSTHFASTPA